MKEIETTEKCDQQKKQKKNGETKKWNDEGDVSSSRQVLPGFCNELDVEKSPMKLHLKFPFRF